MLDLSGCICYRGGRRVQISSGERWEESEREGGFGGEEGVERVKCKYPNHESLDNGPYIANVDGLPRVVAAGRTNENSHEILIYTIEDWSYRSVAKRLRHCVIRWFGNDISHQSNYFCLLKTAESLETLSLLI